MESYTIMKKNNGIPIYTPKKLIPGYKIEPELKGLYAGVPDRGYKGHSFIIKYWYKTISHAGEIVYDWTEMKIKDWNTAVRFKRFKDQWGNGTYTIGYFKIAD